MIIFMSFRGRDAMEYMVALVLTLNLVRFILLLSRAVVYQMNEAN